MEVPKIIEGLQIIQKSKPAGESDYYFYAEHDEIFVGSLVWKMSDEDKKEWKSLVGAQTKALIVGELQFNISLK